MTSASHVLADMTPYAARVALTSSAALGWRGLTLVAACEHSADVEFAGFSRHLLNLTLTGTPRHEARFAGITDGAPTAADTILAVPRGADGRFAFEAPPGGERTLIAEFDDELFAEYCPELADGRFLGGTLAPSAHRARPRLSALMRVLAGELHPDTARGALFADALLRALAVEIAHSTWTRAPGAAARARLSSREAAIVAAHVEDHLGEDLTVAALADLVGMEPAAFSRAFRQAFGRSPYAYVLDVRVESAARLLATTRLSISEIAGRVGFADQQHLTKAFRRRLGRTPASMRT